MNDAGNDDVLIYDLVRDIPTRFTFHPASDSHPVWSPDGEQVVFSSRREAARNLFRKAADGTGEAQRLTTGEADQFPTSWSPDGTTLAFSERQPRGTRDIAVLTMDNDLASETLLVTEFSERYPEVSPDGQWIAYQSDESGRREIYVRPFPNLDTGKWQVSRGGGLAPVWAPDGRELFYRRRDLAMMAVPVETEPTFRPGNAVMLFEARAFLQLPGPRAFDIAPDGQRFLMIKLDRETSEPPTPGQINLVQNWFEELKRLVPID